jgi:hypothetical protein
VRFSGQGEKVLGEKRLNLNRHDGEAVAIDLPDLDPVESPEGVKWIDATHANVPDHYQHDYGHAHNHACNYSHT